MAAISTANTGRVDIYAIQVESRQLDGAGRKEAKVERDMLKNRRHTLVAAHRESLFEQAEALESASFIESLTESLGTVGVLAAQLAGVVMTGLAGPIPMGTLLSMSWGGIAANTAGAYLVSWGAGKGLASGSRRTAIDKEAGAKVEMAQAEAQLTRIDQAQTRIQDHSSRMQRTDEMLSELARFTTGPDTSAKGAGAPGGVSNLAQEQWKTSRDERRWTMRDQTRTSERKLEASKARIEEERVEARAALKAQIAQDVMGAITKVVEVVGYALSVLTYGLSNVAAGLVNYGIRSGVEGEVILPANEEAANARAEAGAWRLFEKRLGNTAEAQRDELAKAQQHADQAEKLLRLANRRA